MTELINWFNNIFYNCYYVKHDDYPNSLFMYYDINYVRKLKLAKIQGKQLLPQINLSGNYMFELEWKNKIWCDYKIWKYLEDNYSTKYSDVQQFIKDRLEDYNNNTGITPSLKFGATKLLSEEYKQNLTILTPTNSGLRTNKILREYFKMNVITPNIYHVKCK